MEKKTQKGNSVPCKSAMIVKKTGFPCAGGTTLDLAGRPIRAESVGSRWELFAMSGLTNKPNLKACKSSFQISSFKASSAVMNSSRSREG